MFQLDTKSSIVILFSVVFLFDLREATRQRIFFGRKRRVLTSQAFHFNSREFQSVFEVFFLPNDLVRARFGLLTTPLLDFGSFVRFAKLLCQLMFFFLN
jgi:hypothetical protein